MLALCWSVPVHSMLPAAGGATLQGSRFVAVTTDLIHIKESLHEDFQERNLNAALTVDAEQRPGGIARPALALAKPYEVHWASFIGG